MRKLCRCMTGAAAVLAAVNAIGTDMNNQTAITILQPCDGDVLNHNDGVETADSLVVQVRGMGPAGTPVYVDGQPAQLDGPNFSCTATLTERHNTLAIKAGDAAADLVLWWDKGSRKRYRFSVDDNIQFLKDLGTAPDKYPSLFDHWYLAFWREMHQTYRAKLHFNIYYQTDGFNLTRMPAKWKNEWRANADWLHLSFHALQDKPDRPYRNAAYEQIARDYDLVCGEIRRFAGPEVLTTTTTVHWAECPKEAVRALRDRGIEQLIGLFGTGHGVTTACYYLNADQSARCDGRPAWFDRDTGVFLIPCAMVVNSYEVPQIKPLLDARTASPHQAELLELLIHEQYFRKDLDLYQPTVMDKVRAALEWAVAHNYEPVFWSDGFLGL